MRKSKIFLIAITALISGGAALLGQRLLLNMENIRAERRLSDARAAAWEGLRDYIRGEIEAFNGEAGIVIKDLETGWEFSHNKDGIFPSASLAKVPIMAACLIAAGRGKIDPDRNIALKGADKLTGSGLLKELPAGALFTVRRLIVYMISESDNTATNMVTNLIGLKAIDSAAKGFGLKNTNFSRRVADYAARDKGIENYTTAEDMALLFEKIYNGGIGGRDISDQCIRVLKLSRLNDRIPKYLPADITVAHKTGLERGVCHDAGIVYTRKGSLIIAVLNKHEKADSDIPKEFIAKISLEAYRYKEKKGDVVHNPGTPGTDRKVMSANPKENNHAGAR